MQKFKSNDSIVLKKHMDRPLDKFESIYRVVDFYKATSDNEYYYVIEPAEPADKFDNSMALKQGYVEESYINMDEVYWYFEKRDIEGGWIKYDDRRHTFKEIIKTMAKNGFIENVYPIYAIGFKLP
ncbi:hypothetical protein [Campylobacter concisus]|jgi:hypothetical protein|uniref:hypothetical protein n=1 Tax=Campylobacter concisus TaxID=199 RepID=UPI000CD85D18|nr:hypothetical protein [Campylobacter concisus]MCA6131393.1 hypothetical protein [Campylobacter concisus]